MGHARWSTSWAYLEQDVDNIREARWGGCWRERTQRRPSASPGMESPWFWGPRGHWTKGRAWLERALALPTQDDALSARGAALFGVASLAWLKGDMPEHARFCEACPALATLAAPGTISLSGARSRS